MGLCDYSYNEARELYNKFFSLKYIDENLDKKLALIAMICYITNKINSGKPIEKQHTCYEIICKIGKDFPDSLHQDFFKALGAICDDLMYQCTEFPTFGIDPKKMPVEIHKILNKWLPF